MYGRFGLQQNTDEGLKLLAVDQRGKNILIYRKAIICGIGSGDLFNELRFWFKEGDIKEEYSYTLRQNQTTCNEMKSKEMNSRVLLSKICICTDGRTKLDEE